MYNNIVFIQLLSVVSVVRVKSGKDLKKKKQESVFAYVRPGKLNDYLYCKRALSHFTDQPTFTFK